MTCEQASSLFSPYLDGAVSGVQMQALNTHFRECSHCSKEYNLLAQTQRLLVATGRRRAPADLSLRLRVAISQEVARSKSPFFGGLGFRLQNAFRAFMVPATAGLVVAVTVFAAIMGSVTVPLQSATDVPFIKTAPQFKQSQFGMSLDSSNDDSVVVEAYVDPFGRVDGYRILSNSKTAKELVPQVENMLIFTTFRPATYMGTPTSGRAVLSFSKVNVRG